MSKVIIVIMCFFAVLGAIDKIIGNKIGIGEKFEEGFMAMGSMAFAILGIYTLSPVLATVILKVIGPVFELIEIDPSILSGIFLGIDMGGYSAATMMAESSNLANYSGVILASMLGTTISFTIPMASGIIKKEDYDFFSKGLLIGITTIPIGAFVGGVLCGLSNVELILNIIPIIIISMVLSIGIKKYPEKTIRMFKGFSNGIQIVGIIGLILGIVQMNFDITLLPGMDSFSEGINIVLSISVILAGAYPLIHIITKYLGKQLDAIGKKIGIGNVAVVGIIASLANNVATFGMFDKMDNKGKVINAAFAVSGAFTLGGQLAYTIGVDESLIVPFLLSKLVAGVSAIVTACVILRKERATSMKVSVEV